MRPISCEEPLAKQLADLKTSHAIDDLIELTKSASAYARTPEAYCFGLAARDGHAGEARHAAALQPGQEWVTLRRKNIVRLVTNQVKHLFPGPIATGRNQ